MLLINLLSMNFFAPKWSEICNLTPNSKFFWKKFFQTPLIILSYCSLKLVKFLIFKKLNNSKPEIVRWNRKLQILNDFYLLAYFQVSQKFSTEINLFSI